MPSLNVLRIEKFLAIAHRALYAAWRTSGETTDDGLEEDIMGLCVEIERIQTDLLKRGRRVRRTIS